MSLANIIITTDQWQYDMKTNHQVLIFSNMCIEIALNLSKDTHHLFLNDA